MKLVQQVVLLGFVAPVACHDPPPPSLDVCTDVELGKTKCLDDTLLECNGRVYVVKHDCDECIERPSGDVDCVLPQQLPPAAMFEPCRGDGQANCLTADLTCGEVTLLSDGELCVVDCSSDPSMCQWITIGERDVEGYCEPGDIEGGGAFSSSPFCYPLSARNGPCLFNDDGCAGDGTTCEALRIGGLNLECKLRCPGNELGTTSTCPATELCLAAGFVEIEQEDEDDLGCSAPGTPDNCTEAEGYTCTEVGHQQTAALCARMAGLCGLEAVPTGPVDSEDELDALLEDDAVMCRLLGVDQYCGADDAAGAVSECVATSMAFPYQSPISCGGVDDYVGCFGFGVCATFDGVSYECVVPASICQRFCVTRDGVDLTVGGTHNPCDGGQTCQLPGYPVGPLAVQHDDRVPRSCEGDASACTDGFECDGALCTRGREVCGE